MNNHTTQNALSITLVTYFNAMFDAYGPLSWWPGDTPFEVIIGAILTQNTTWKNVEKCIRLLKQHNLMDPHRLRQLDTDTLKELIRSSGYYNQKTKKINHFLDYFDREYRCEVHLMIRQPLEKLRGELLELNGIGPETADSILLYALNKPVFVVDAYTRRILSRHAIIEPTADYETIRMLFENTIPRDVALYNEFHALIVNVGKDFCRTRPLCDNCPLRQFLP